MRGSIRVIIFLTVAAFIMTMAGCSLSGPDVSIEDRIDKFESDLDANRWSSLYEHVHPDNGKRNQTKDSTYWQNYFNGGSYSFSNPKGSGDSRTVTVTSSDGTWDGQQMTFEMKEHKDGPLSRSSWYIDGITSTVATVL